MLTARVLRDAVPLAAFVVVAGALLILTVAHEAGHPQLPNTSKGDIVPAYATALGGSDTAYVDEYQVDSELPAFVGHATYAGEQLLTWWSEKDTHALIEPIGMFHAEFNAVTGPFPNLVASSEEKIESRRPAQVLLMGFTGEGFYKAVRWLAPYKPRVVRTGRPLRRGLPPPRLARRSALLHSQSTRWSTIDLRGVTRLSGWDVAEFRLGETYGAACRTWLVDRGLDRPDYFCGAGGVRTRPTRVGQPTGARISREGPIRQRCGCATKDVLRRIGGESFGAGPGRHGASTGSRSTDRARAEHCLSVQ